MHLSNEINERSLVPPFLANNGILRTDKPLRQYSNYMVSLHITYHQASNVRRTVVNNTIVDHSNVVGASPVGVAPTTSSFST